MEFESIQLLAGFASTVIFASSKVPMLTKAIRTRDLHSYSISHIGLSTAGNMINWLYVISLPLGPVWLLQGLFTMADLLMLVCYVVFEHWGALSNGFRFRHRSQAPHGQHTYQGSGD
jgi:hypothetical protein